MSFRPLTESLTYDQAKIKVIHEGKDDQKHYYMEGVFIQGGVVNENKRVYPVEQIRGAVDSIKEKINGGYSVMGECDHPHAEHGYGYVHQWHSVRSTQLGWCSHAELP